MKSFAHVAATRPLSVSVIAALVIIFGLYSLTGMDLDLFPDIQSPTVMVTVKAGNHPALEMEALYGERIEQRLFTVRGLRSVEQTVRTGQLITRVTLDWGADIDLALVEVNRALANIATEKDVDEVTIRRFDPRQLPVVVIGLTALNSEADLSDIRQLALRQFAPLMEKRKGVAEVRVNGGREKHIEVRIDPHRLQSFDLTLDEVASKIKAANINVNVGTLIDDERVLLVQGQGRFATTRDISQVIVSYLEDKDGDVYPLKVEDFANVDISLSKVTGLVRVDGEEGLSLSVYKEGGANTVKVSRTVRQTLRNLARDYPNLRFTTVVDEAILVESAINEVKFAAIVGMLLATGILALFLRSPGPILIVALTIPVSLLGTICAMRFSGFNLNLMTLGGLAIGTGLLVDNAIVVIESIYRRRSSGDSPIDAAVNGVAAVGGSIVSSTLTTCVVFLPVVFIDGLAAEITSGIAFTVVISLIASLLVATLLIPALSIWFLPRHNIRDVELRAPYLQVLLGKLLDKPLSVIATAAVLIAFAALALSRLGTNLLPPADPQQLVFNLSAPAGQSVQATSRMVAQIERLMSAVAGDQLESVLTELGRLDVDEQRVLERQSEENTAKILARLNSAGSGAEAIVESLKPLTSQLQGVDIDWQVSNSALSQALGISGSALTVEVTGRSLPGIRSVAEDIRLRLGQHPALWNARTSLDGAPPQLRLRLKPLAAAQWGVDLDHISTVLEATLDGKVVTSLVQGDEQTDVRISLPQTTAQNLKNLRFRSEAGHWISLDDVVNIETQAGAREIFRRDQRRIAKVTALVSEGYSSPQARAAVMDVLASSQYPLGIRATLTGEEAERVKSVEDFRWAAVLALLLVFMVLTASFESLVHPLTILSAVPVALIGVAIVLTLLGQPIGIMAMLGFVILVGIAVNDAILLVQATRARQAQGCDTREALCQAVQLRLRPIVMTTATTVLALLPLAVGGGDAAELRVPLAWTVIGGVIASTVGSLTVVPCVYLVFEQFSRPAPVELATR